MSTPTSIHGHLHIEESSGTVRSLEVEGALEAYDRQDAAGAFRGTVHVPESEVEQLRSLMERQARGGDERPLANYSGQIYEQGREATRVVEGAPVLLRAVEPTGSVTLEATQPETPRS